MKLIPRSYQGEGDYWKIREFLRRVFLVNDRRELSWQPYRFDYWRWHGIDNLGHGSLESDVFIWEAEGDQIQAVLNSEEPGYAYLQVDPRFRVSSLEQQMVVIAEENLAVTKAGKRPRLNIFTGEQDEIRQEILVKHGFQRTKYWERHHRCLISKSFQAVELPEGFKVRALGDINELPARSYLSWKVFHPDEPDED